MIHLRSRVFLLFFILMALSSLMHSFVAPVSSQQQEENNLLTNPGFEAMFMPWEGEDAVRVANGWTPWWSEDKNHDPQWVRPDYVSAVIEIEQQHVRSGGVAQQWSTFHASHYGGMYQVIRDVVPGSTYRFSIYSQVWSSTENEPRTKSTLPSNPRLHVGIDPLGFENPFSSDIAWSSEASMESVIDRWGIMNVEVVAQADVITVYMRTNPDFANKHNNIYWDDASLVLVSQPTATPFSAFPVPEISTTRLTPLPTTVTTFTAVTPASVVTRAPEVATLAPTAIPLPIVEPSPIPPQPTQIVPTATRPATAMPTATLVSLPAPEVTTTANAELVASIEPTKTTPIVTPTEVTVIVEITETAVSPTDPPIPPTETPVVVETSTPEPTSTPPVDALPDESNRSGIYIVGLLAGLLGAGFVWRSRNS